jgi:hypothetical protein
VEWLPSSLLLILAWTVCLAPALFLGMGWRALRAGRFGSADTWLTFADLGSVFLMACEALLAVILVFGWGAALLRDGAAAAVGIALFSYPPTVWWFTRTLMARLVRERPGRPLEGRPLEWWAKYEGQRRREDGPTASGGGPAPRG